MNRNSINSLYFMDYGFYQILLKKTVNLEIKYHMKITYKLLSK